MGLELRMPNITASTEREQLTQIKSYLYQLIPELQWALNTLDTTAEANYIVPQAPKSIAPKATNITDPEVAFDAIKPFILNSADILQAYYKEINTRLSSVYLAQSVFDTFVEQATDIRITKSLNAQGWYKVGTLSGEMCAVATLTVGGMSPSMVDIATQDSQARTFLRLPSLADNQISKVGVVMESANVYGVYAYYNSADENTVGINIHIHMGAFVSASLEAASVTDSDMLSSINVKQ